MDNIEPEIGDHQDQESDVESQNRPDECLTCHRQLVRGREVTFPCGHAFCQRCIRRYVHDTHDPSCPVCADENEQRLLPGQSRPPDTIYPPSGNQDLLVRRPVPNRPPVCAICYSTARDRSRGRIHCCDHYFCFECIYNAAMVAPYCPTCRRHFYQIQSEYPENMRLTRGMNEHNAIYDLPEQRFIQLSEMGTRDTPPDFVFTEVNAEGVRVNSPCRLCDTPGFLRMCANCMSLIHHVCAEPVWNPYERRWECVLCTTLNRANG